MALAVGLVIGVAMSLVLMTRAAAARAEGAFDSWLATQARRATQAALADGRAGWKRLVGDEMAPRMRPLPFEAGDVRFVGHPVHFVVFDGYGELRSSSSGEIREVVLVTATGPAWGRDDDELVSECVGAGRVRWQTLRIGGPAPPARLPGDRARVQARRFSPQ